ncbi:flagellar biosynthesis protein FlgA [Polymorphospora lycopeni]|uniref:Flagellar biosynthesis protein FlgA n=1 Tax=Polymorphospora lycopeni TaxID=3140240 RepID=A0ABV5CT53_9ACTN
MFRRTRSGDADGALTPVRWPGRPRPATVLRAALVAVLLALAAAVLTARADPDRTAACGPPIAADPTGPPSGGSFPAPDAPPGRLAVPAGSVGVPVRPAEPAALAVVRPGSRIDLLALPAGAGAQPAPEPLRLATGALVLDVVAVDGATALYLALTPDQANRTLGMPETTRFGVVVPP